MKIISSIPEITFDDVLLLPNKSDFLIRQEYKEINLNSRISKKITLKIPLASAPMPGVTESQMAITLGKLGGIGFIHPFQSYKSQLKQIYEVKRRSFKVAASVVDFDSKILFHIEDLVKAGADLISLETLHAYNSPTLNLLKKIKTKFNRIEVCVGVIVTAEAAEAIIKAGADCIRVGIGGGSHCTTRLITGVGRPQLSALYHCYSVTKRYKIPIISDCGIKYPGDIVKALVFGADAVIIGGLLSGTDESPGNIVNRNGKRYKYSWGMCTRKAYQNRDQPYFYSFMQKTSYRILSRINRLLNKDLKEKSPSYGLEEGIEGLALYKGSAIDVLHKLTKSVYRSMWYLGGRNITNLREKAKIVIVSPNTHSENLPRI